MYTKILDEGGIKDETKKWDIDQNIFHPKSLRQRGNTFLPNSEILDCFAALVNMTEN